MERNNTPTTHTNFPAQTLVQKLDSGYNHCKLYKCPVAWGFVWVQSDASNHHRQSRPNILYMEVKTMILVIVLCRFSVPLTSIFFKVHQRFSLSRFNSKWLPSSNGWVAALLATGWCCCLDVGKALAESRDSCKDLTLLLI